MTLVSPVYGLSTIASPTVCTDLPDRINTAANIVIIAIMLAIASATLCSLTPLFINSFLLVLTI